MVESANGKGSSDRRSILIVDDHPMLRLGLVALIGTDPGLTVCGQAESFSDAFQAIKSSQPDLVIVDIALDGRDGLDILLELKARYPDIPALVLSMHDESLYGERCLRAGARGYITKLQLDSTVLVAIQRVLAGEIYMSDKLGAMLAERFIGHRTLADESPLTSLSNRELQVYQLIGQGHSTREIAEQLTLSIKTIESHIEHVKRRLSLKSATELAHHAIQWVESSRKA